MLEAAMSHLLAADAMNVALMAQRKDWIKALAVEIRAAHDIDMLVIARDLSRDDPVG